MSYLLRSFERVSFSLTVLFHQVGTNDRQAADPTVPGEMPLLWRAAYLAAATEHPNSHAKRHAEHQQCL